VHVELKRAQRVRDAFDGVRERVGEVIEWVNGPLVSTAIMGSFLDPVEHWISHQHIGRSHVNFGPKDVRSVVEFSLSHAT
jgi:hypothetical protein